MSDSVIAAQLYTVREFTKTPEDIAKTMKKVREIGYKAVQLSALGPIDVNELKKILDAEGLTACASHVSLEEARNQTDRVIEEHKILGCKYVAIAALPKDIIVSQKKRLKSERSLLPQVWYWAITITALSWKNSTARLVWTLSMMRAIPNI